MLLRGCLDLFAALPPFPLGTRFAPIFISVGGGEAAGTIDTPSEKQSFSANRAAKPQNRCTRQKWLFMTSLSHCFQSFTLNLAAMG